MTDKFDAEMEEDPYKHCVLYSTTCFGKCGPFTRYRQAKHGLTKVSDLGSSTVEHIQNLKFRDITRTWTEQELIENRIKSNLDGSSLICQHHRYSLGISWEQKKQCAHPRHQKEKVVAKHVLPS